MVEAVSPGTGTRSTARIVFAKSQIAAVPEPIDVKATTELVALYRHQLASFCRTVRVANCGAAALWLGRSSS
jgi:hypothetical protein